MTSPYSAHLVRSLALLAVLLPSAAHAQGSQSALVKDIYPGGIGSEPGWGGATDPSVVINGVMFFTARAETTGVELWKTDGTGAGTVLVKDIWPGSFPGPSPHSFTNVNGTLFFFASDPDHGAELWKSDGTAGGTVLVQDIVSGPGSSVSPTGADRVVKDGVLYFVASDISHGYELWRSDGTAAGTFMVRDIRTNTPSGLSPGTSGLINVNGTLFFAANDGVTGNELWSSDGTSAGQLSLGTSRPACSTRIRQISRT